ncbi:DUF5615 family PIN-like protein [Thermoflexus hugenholtzii]
MGISPKTVHFLRSLGYDAVHLHEEGLERLEDQAILAKAREENRVLLTHDLDFSELIAAGGARLPSVIVFRPEHAPRSRQPLFVAYHRTLSGGSDERSHRERNRRTRSGSCSPFTCCGFGSGICSEVIQPSGHQRA